jgi:hypothetical protein
LNKVQNDPGDEEGEMEPQTTSCTDITVGQFKGVPAAPSPTASVPSSSSTSSALKADLTCLLGQYLGRYVDGYGKSAVMALSNGGTAPRFNKYSGIYKNLLYQDIAFI